MRELNFACLLLCVLIALSGSYTNMPGISQSEARNDRISNTKDDQSEIDGKWRVVDIWRGDKKLKEFRNKVISFHDGLTNLRSNGANPQVRFAINNSRSPKEFDLITERYGTQGTLAPPVKVHYLGIYKLDRQRLVICFRGGSGLSRPKSFELPKKMLHDYDQYFYRIILERMESSGASGSKETRTKG